MRLPSGVAMALAVQAAAAAVPARNSTYYNPVLPGWHSDPSCVQVDGIFYCVTSTFISFPGLPVYASRDLVNWRLVSHVWNRESQLPGYSWATEGQQQGMYAATIRFRAGVFYVVCEYLGVDGRDAGVLFRTTDPLRDAAWSDAVTFAATKIDPDLFWDDGDDDDDGTAYVATQGIQLQRLDLATGALGPAVPLWNGTGGVWPEGPHLYKRGRFYYLLIAEGGTALDHAVTMARSEHITGPYVPAPANPLLTNRGTGEYFQTVGHADLFQDARGNWWGMCLATRSGPAYRSYPMGREAVLFPVSWDDGDEWPVLQPVRGRMSGWPLPARTRDVPGDGPFNDDPDEYDFGEARGPLGPGAPIPRNLVHWRVPREGAFAITERGLQVVLSRNSLSGEPGTVSARAGGAAAAPAPARAVSFVGRRQTHSLFTFSVDLSFAPRAPGQEAGVTAFLTQGANIQLGVALSDDGRLSFRFNVSGTVQTTSVPTEWKKGRQTIRLEIRMDEPTEYVFSAMLAADAKKTRAVVGKASAELLSGGTGSFVGTLLGVYATCNGAGSGLDCPPGTPKAYFQRWRYAGVAQYVSETESVPAENWSRGPKHT